MWTSRHPGAARERGTGGFREDVYGSQSGAVTHLSQKERVLWDFLPVKCALAGSHSLIVFK